MARSVSSPGCLCGQASSGPVGCVFGSGWRRWESGVDTNCRSFDISISTAGRAASHCEWEVALRRPEIRHAVGRLCPGSAPPLTQLPRGARRALRFPPRAGETPPCTAPISHLALSSPGCTLIADTQEAVCAADKKPPDSLLTGTGSPSRSQTQGTVPDASRSRPGMDKD